MSNSGIYALFCPDTARIRYVGQSSNIMLRFKQHVSNRKSDKAGGYYGNWIRSLKSSPLLIVLELTDDLDAREQYWISFFRRSGCRLVNTGKGGEKYPTDHVYQLKRKFCAMFGHQSSIAEKMRVIIAAYNDADINERREINSFCGRLIREIEDG